MNYSLVEEHKCANMNYGFNCVCKFCDENPGIKHYACQWHGIYSASKPVCGNCEEFDEDNSQIQRDFINAITDEELQKKTEVYLSNHEKVFIKENDNIFQICMVDTKEVIGFASDYNGAEKLALSVGFVVNITYKENVNDS